MKNLFYVLALMAIGGTGCKKEQKPAQPDQPEITNTNVIPMGLNDSTIHNGSLADPHIKYFGRWVFTDPREYINKWGGSYFKVNFTGTTARMKVNYATNYYTKIDDGAWISYSNKSGIINLTPVALAN